MAANLVKAGFDVRGFDFRCLALVFARIYMEAHSPRAAVPKHCQSCRLQVAPSVRLPATAPLALTSS